MTCASEPNHSAVTAGRPNRQATTALPATTINRRGLPRCGQHLAFQDLQ